MWHIDVESASMQQVTVRYISVKDGCAVACLITNLLIFLGNLTVCLPFSYG